MRGGAAAGLVLVTVCGVFTAYTTLQPELEKQKQQREGTFVQQHTSPEDQEKIISKAILSDLREAKEEAKDATARNGGFAWGIRKALFGPKQQSTPSQSGLDATASPSQPLDSKDNSK